MEFGLPDTPGKPQRALQQQVDPRKKLVIRIGSIMKRFFRSLLLLLSRHEPRRSGRLICFTPVRLRRDFAKGERRASRGKSGEKEGSERLIERPANALERIDGQLHTAFP